jgi:DNA-binding protein H-NS
MANLKNLTVKQLKKLTEDAKKEITAKRKKNKVIERVREQMERKLAKAGLSITDLYPTLEKGQKPVATKKNKKAKAKAKAGKRALVAPKYKDTAGKNKWTGRGRSPLWVKEICERDGIDVVAFKTLPQYRI